jgi:hypothetical protein
MSKMDDSKLSRSEFMKREMSKFTDIQKGYLKQFVADCVMNRFSTEESMLYLKDRLGVEVEEDEFNYLKADLKRDLKRNIEYLRRHENAYVQEYFDRIEEMRLIHKRLWKLVEENPHNPILQKDCLSELCKSTIAVADFYRSIKELDQASATVKDEPSMISASSLESEATPAPKIKSGEALKEEPSKISASSLESEATPAPKVKSGEALKEESEMISTSSPETKPTPPEVEPSEAMKEESEMIRTSNPETTPTPTPEVEIPQQYTPKKIAKYTSEGKLVTVGS